MVDVNKMRKQLLEAGRLHTFAGPPEPHGVPDLEGTQLPPEAPTHGPIDTDHVDGEDGPR